MKQKITMNFLYKRNNRNRHFQIAKENLWLATGRVFTGLGLHNAIQECGRLSLVGKYEKEYRDDIKNFSKMVDEQMKFHQELCDCIIIGTNKDAMKTERGQKIIHAGWEDMI